MSEYECDKCGACCRNLLLEVDDIDVLREPRLVAADAHYANLPMATIWQQLADECRALLLAAPGSPCPFLQENQCSIYPTRPNACVAMPAGDDQCQQARMVDGLPPLAPVVPETEVRP